jgi:hypothetical protein
MDAMIKKIMEEGRLIFEWDVKVPRAVHRFVTYSKNDRIPGATDSLPKHQLRAYSRTDCHGANCDVLPLCDSFRNAKFRKPALP